MTLYLDTNSWSKISELLISDKLKYRNLLNSVDRNVELQVLYSKINVKETLKRSIQDHIQNDFTTYRDFAKCRLLDIHGYVKIVDPERVKALLIEDELVANSLKPLFDHLVEEQVGVKKDGSSGVKNAFSSEILNNVPKDKIITELEKLINESIINQGGGNPHPTISFDNELLESIVKENIKRSTTGIRPIPNQEEIESRYAKVFSNFIQRIIGLSSNLLNESSNGKIGVDMFSSLYNAIPEKRIMTALFTGLLGTLQYYPDSKKLLEKKGIVIDMDDISHVTCASHCNIFVTNDSKFVKRALAAMEKTKLNMKIIGIDDFYDLANGNN